MDLHFRVSPFRAIDRCRFISIAQAKNIIKNNIGGYHLRRNLLLSIDLGLTSVAAASRQLFNSNNAIFEADRFPP